MDLGYVFIIKWIGLGFGLDVKKGNLKTQKKKKKSRITSRLLTCPPRQILVSFTQMK